jgi:hypothetical protein
VIERLLGQAFGNVLAGADDEITNDLDNASWICENSASMVTRQS